MAALAKTAAVGVLGAGTMGQGIAQIAAQAGHPVILFDTKAGAAQQALDNIKKLLLRSVEKGRITSDQCDQALSLLAVGDSLEDLAPAKLIVEVIIEDLGIKQQVFQKLEGMVTEDTILASNTSSLSITAIGATLKRPENLVGMHFFNPAPLMKLVEVISGLATNKAVADTIYDTAVAWGKKPVHAKSTPGFIVNRVARPFYAEALRIATENAADVATIDAVLRESGGFRMGAFELMDLIGHDVNYAVTNSVYNAYYNDQRFLPSLMQKELVDGGFLGRKSGRGFYSYAEGTEKPAPVTIKTQLPAPKSVTLVGEAGIPTDLLTLIEEAGISLHHKESSEENYLQVGDATLMLTTGFMATQQAEDSEIDDLIFFDLALDYAKATRIALAPADQATEKAIEDAIGLFQALGKKVTVMDDCPGMIVMRTICMLANEGADAVNQGVCDVAAVDTAMCNGVNYPKGPLAWADEIGLVTVMDVLDNLGLTYGEDRYRVSPLIQRYAYARRDFYV